MIQTCCTGEHMLLPPICDLVQRSVVDMSMEIIFYLDDLPALI